jgi:hypothetical protein
VSEYIAAIETLRTCAQQLAGELSADERARVIELHERALQVVLYGPRQRARTLDLIERIAKLDNQLADRDASERVRIITERLGISRSRYFALRSPDFSKTPA